MRNAIAVVTVLVAMCASVANAQIAPNAFKDVEPEHWAAQALEALRAKNILVGYPDGLYRGRRTLTRYELAVALDRLLKSLPTTGAGQPGQPGPAGPQGDVGPQGIAGPAGMTPDDVAAIRKMADEFKDELTMLGNNVTAVNTRLDKLAQDVGDLTKRVNSLPTIKGRVFLGARGDLAKGMYVDHDGRVTPLGTRQAVVHNLDLSFTKEFESGFKLNATLQAGNYTNYLGGNSAQIPAVVGGLSSSVPTSFALREMNLTTPVCFFEKGSDLTVGRFTEKIDPLVFWKPRVDSYFRVPDVSGGSYSVDGARLNLHFGSLGAQVVAAQIGSVQDTGGQHFNQPLAGAGGPAAYQIFGQFGANNMPIGQPAQGQMAVDQVMGMSLWFKLPVLHGSTIKLTGLDMANRGSAPVGVQTGVWGLGVNADINLGAAALHADYAKSINHKGNDHNVGPNMDNSALMVDFKYHIGSMRLSAGYKDIDPLFSAPGYWGNIGNWINPTNIQGPYVKGRLNVTKRLSLDAGWESYTAARNRADVGSLGPGDTIDQIRAGLRMHVVRHVSTGLKWEGVFWKLNGPHGGMLPLNTGHVHVTECFLTPFLCCELEHQSSFRFSYQRGEFDGHGSVNQDSTGTKTSWGVVMVEGTKRF